MKKLIAGALTLVAGMVGAAAPRMADLGEVKVGGELAVRLQRNFDRLEEKKYLPENVFLTMKQSWDWPGDTEGRTILGLVLDAQATGRKPKHLDAILAKLPSKLNEKGYMGPVFPGKLHEQQLSGNGWLLVALCEHYRWTKDPQSLATAKRLLESLFLPGRGQYASYPIDPAARFKDRGAESGNIVQEIGPWMLSTDIGCVFIAMDAMIRAYEFLPSAELKACIEELLPRFLAVDQVAIKAQAHATLTALRGLLRYADLTGETRWREAAEKRFATYCANCMSENFENYNWYERFDKQSETCAVVDSYMLANEFWRQTGKVEYLELAELIYWNALGHLQHRNGGFGLDTCPGKGFRSDELKVHTPEAHWCCTMRGAEGLATAVRCAVFVRGKDALVACPRQGEYALAVAGGSVRFRVTGGYPFDASFAVELLDDLPAGSALRVFRPHWTDFTSVRVNGAPVRFAESAGFVTPEGRLSRGDRVTFTATFKDWTRALQVARNGLDGQGVRKFRGPLQLGLGADGELKPIYHLMDPALWTRGSGAKKIVFADDGQADRADPRTRTFVLPKRVVWTTEQDTQLAYGKRSTVTNAESLCRAKFGQTPEYGWGGGAEKCCLLRNRGTVPSVILDFGREIHGGLSIGSSPATPIGSKVRIRFGESVAETCSEIGERGATNDHAIRDGVYTLPMMGAMEIGNTGFRFVRIDGLTPGDIRLESVRAISLMRPMPRLGEFRSSDERLNRVWATAARTVHLCCQDYLWDGIKRDRLVWMGDTHPETMSILNVFGDASVLPESLDQMAAVTSPTQWMNNMCPYTFWFIRNVREWWYFTGDRSYLEKHHAYLKATFDNIERHISPSNTLTGIRRPFLDWPTEHNRPAVLAGMQALAVMAARTGVELAEAVGDAAWAEQCRRMEGRLQSIRPQPEGSKQAAALLALTRLQEPKAMFAEVLGANGHKGVSTFYGYYMLEAMVAAGETQRAIDTVRDYWGAMLDMGATSFWEDFNLAWTNNAFRIDQYPVAGKKDVHGDYGEFCYPGFRHSLCHGWSSGPASWLINRVLGIRPAAPGCRKVVVDPYLGTLDWAEGAMALPGGRAVKVRVSRKEDGSLDVKVDAPADIEVIRPSGAKD